MGITCADCGNDQAVHNSPHQGKTAAEGGVAVTPRQLCQPCYDTAFSIEYPGEPQQGSDQPPRPNPGDVPA